MSIGRDLLDVPFAEMVRNLAIAIADGQTALDRNSLETLKVLADLQVEVLTEVTEVIEPSESTVTAGGSDIVVTGARVRTADTGTTPMSMLQAGLYPTFYQFTEASVEVRIAITMRQEEQRETSGTTGGTVRSGGFLGLGVTRAYASSVDFRTQNTYSYSATGSSVLKATLRPVPPPSRLQPSLTTVNTFTDPPTITRV